MTVLLRQVSEELAQVQAFVDLLDREARALILGRFELLPGLTEQKREAAERIAACDTGRERLLATMGYSADREGADAAAAHGGPALLQAWQRLLVLAAQAREKNHRNGLIVHAHLDYTRQSIAFLQAGNGSLYGPDGQHRASGGSGRRYAAG